MVEYSKDVSLVDHMCFLVYSSERTTAETVVKERCGASFEKMPSVS